MTRILGPLLLGLIGVGILLWLGTWQMQRLTWKQGVLAEIEARIGGTALPLPDMPNPERDRYQPVRLSGTVGTEELYVLVSQKRIGAGYRIISPLTLDSGQRVLLDKGFIKVDAKSAPRQSGQVDITGNLHWPDDRNSSTPDNDVAGNTWFARDIDQMAQVLNTDPLLVITRDMSPADPGVTPLPVDTSGIPNDHLQYAITWFSLAAIWATMSAALIWRQSKGKEG